MPETTYPVRGQEGLLSNMSTRGFCCCQLPCPVAGGGTHLSRPPTCAHHRPWGAAC